MPLSGCKYTIEGYGLQKPQCYDFRDVQPKEDVTFTGKFVPKRSGQRTVVATFNSNRLQGVGGSTFVTVQ